MKAIIYTPIVLALLLAACNNKPEQSACSGCSSEVVMGDTCNRTDCNGLKQGNWLIYKGKAHTLDNIVDTVMYKDGVIQK